MMPGGDDLIKAIQASRGGSSAINPTVVMGGLNDQSRALLTLLRKVPDVAPFSDATLFRSAQQALYEGGNARLLTEHARKAIPAFSGMSDAEVQGRLRSIIPSPIEAPNETLNADVVGIAMGEAAMGRKSGLFIPGLGDVTRAFAPMAKAAEKTVRAQDKIATARAAASPSPTAPKASPDQKAFGRQLNAAVARTQRPGTDMRMPPVTVAAEQTAVAPQPIVAPGSVVQPGEIQVLPPVEVTGTPPAGPLISQPPVPINPLLFS